MIVIKEIHTNYEILYTNFTELVIKHYFKHT
jgi:hypothetical protein